MTDNKKDNLATALAKFRTLLVQPKKDGLNPHFKSKYVTLDGVIAAIDDAASKSGLTYIQTTDFKDGHFGLITTIMDMHGNSMSGFYVLPSTGKPQEIGAAVTYAKRYALSAAFGVVADEDDDGNTAAPVIKQPTAEENKLFDNFKKTIKASETIEGLDAFIAAAKGNMAKLPEDLKAELRNVIAETKLNLGGR